MMKYIVLIISILCSVNLHGQDHGSAEAERLIKNGQYEQAHLLLKNSGGNNPEKLTLIGDVSMRLGKLAEAEEYLNKALQILINDSLADKTLQASVLNKLALTYWSQGQYQEAEKFMYRAIDLRNNQPATNPELMAGSYNDLGLITSKTNPEDALKNYQKAISIYKEKYGNTSEKVAQGLINTGILLRDLKKYRDALNNFTQAGKIMRNLYPQGHPTVAFTEVNLGSTYRNMGLKPAALVSYNNAIEQYKVIYGEKHPEIANAFNLIGSLKLDEGDHDGALENFQKSLIANTKDFKVTDFEINPPLDSYYHPYTLLNSVYNKAKTYQSLHFTKSLKLFHLKQAMRSLEYCDSLIKNLRHAVANEEDKIAFNAVASKIYDEAVFLAYQIADKSFSKKEYLEKAFYFNEQSKASVLQQAINSTYAKTYAGLPEETLNAEKSLQSRINFIAQKLREKPEHQVEATLRSELLELERSHRDLIKKIETDHPEYYSLKYQPTDLSIENIRQQLDPHTALLSYFVSESNNRLYIFLITKKSYKVFERFIDRDFERFIAGLRNSLYFRDKETFLFTAQYLEKLLLPSISSEIEHLVIIPSGPLNVVPFETLLTKKSSQTAFGQLPYLLRDYSLSYAYATPLYFKNLSEKSSSAHPSLLMAPVDFNYQNLRLPSLPATEEECKQISAMLTSHQMDFSLYTKEQAVEEVLKNGDHSNYNIIHLATHGYIDQKNPALSRIYLNDSQDDGRLYAGELYGLHLNSNLVTLSACETGLGRITQGEGVLGFTRALLFAGAKNLLVSFWKVQDNSTAQLMVDFYKNSFETTGFAPNLRKAKLEMINSDDYSDPYYWAPFILIGN